MKQKLLIMVWLIGTLSIISSCAPTSTAPPSESEQLPTAAATLSEIVNDLSSDDMAVRLVSIYRLSEFGEDAKIAIPALINNLHVDDPDVKIAATIALGHLGKSAKPAIPDLINILNDSDVHASAAAADALGFIGERDVVPKLASTLFSTNPYGSYEVAIACAVSIAKITGEKFTDYDSKTGYLIDEAGVPLIVKDAQNWWLNTGQYQDWSR